MDIKVFNVSKEKIVKEDEIELEELKEIFRNKISKMLKLDILKENYYIEESNNNYIEILFLDENKRMGLVEFRMSKDGAIIKNGLNHIDYIKSHLSEFKILVSDKYKKTNDVIFDPYLIILGPFFNKDDYNAICHIPYDICLFTINKYKNDVIVNKAYVSRKMNFNNFTAKINKENEKEIKTILDYTLSLSDEVTVYGYDKMIIFKRMFNFLTIIVNGDKNIIYLKKKDKWTEVSVNKTLKALSDIEKAFDCN